MKGNILSARSGQSPRPDGEKENAVMGSFRSKMSAALSKGSDKEGQSDSSATPLSKKGKKAVVMVDDENELQDNLNKARKPNIVTIRLQCENLISVDFGSASDPYAILYIKAEKDKNWRKLGQTETLNDNLSP